jgi:DNA-binding MarR family transcriptional regulator
MKSAKSHIHPRPRPSDELRLSESIGYQVRITHHALQRLLQARIAPHGITLGMWYFLRALWNEDGLTQSELSRRIGTSEPTALIAIKTMEKRGLVRRARVDKDRRKRRVYLTAKAGRLEAELIPIVRDVVDIANRSFSASELSQVLRMLGSIRLNVQNALIEIEGAGVAETQTKRGRAPPIRKS